MKTKSVRGKQLRGLRNTLNGVPFGTTVGTIGGVPFSGTIGHETKKTLEPGDLVRLRSGGPKMVIVSMMLGSGRANVAWFDGGDGIRDYHLQTAELSLASLAPV
jgi:prepilin-type processing-associated H-X9-DG protein